MIEQILHDGKANRTKERDSKLPAANDNLAGAFSPGEGIFAGVAMGAASRG